MAQTSELLGTTSLRLARWQTALPLCAALSLCMVSAFALLDTARATSPDGLQSLRFGRPLTWLVQNQTSLDPPTFPSDQRFLFAVGVPGRHPRFAPDWRHRLGARGL